jgi:hypothetical protein
VLVLRDQQTVLILRDQHAVLALRARLPGRSPPGTTTTLFVPFLHTATLIRDAAALVDSPSTSALARRAAAI